MLMDERTIKEQHEGIIHLLEDRRLKEAQTQLAALLETCADWSLHNRLEQAQTSYHYMLQYMKQGTDDPQRHKLYLQLLAETWTIADQAQLVLLDDIATSGFYQYLHHKSRQTGNRLEEWLHTLETFQDDVAVCRLMADSNDNLSQLLKRHEDTNRNLFQAVWGNSEWSTEESAQAQAFLNSELLRSIDLGLLVSAVTMSLQACFDIRKCLWLLDACGHAEAIVAQRALTGVLLTLNTYPERSQLYPELAVRLSLLDENGQLGKDLNRIGLQLLQSQETEKIDKKMREEIIPEMIKNVSKIKGMKLGLEETADENDRNPDWEQAFEKSGLGDKIREMNELQMEGADIYMSTFAQLKSGPFFGQLHNWFYPFDQLHSSVANLFGPSTSGDNVVLNMVLQSGFFCNSDKYSLCFTMAQLPQSQRSLMLHQLTPQELNDMMDNEQAKTLKQYSERPEVISNQYIHDLYRFFKLCYRRREFRDPFQNPFAFHRIPLLKGILDKPELLKSVADFHFRKEHYPEALDLYQRLETTYETDADLLQKSGYCLQKERRYAEAVQAYRKADILKPDHVWTIRHLATCYRQMHDFGSALEYYRKAENIQPENANILFFAGSCHAELEEYKEALQYFFKMDFLDSHSLKAWRGIAWCSFMSRKYGQAEKYYQKLLQDEQALPTDWLNAGHVAWAQGQLETAATRYGKAITLCGSKTQFLELFDKNRDILVQHGIREEDIPLMLDIAG